MSTNEKYNEQAVAAALKTATEQIETMANNFKAEREQISAQLNQSGTSLGGAAGKQAFAAFEAENETAFQNLNEKEKSFMNRSTEIAKASAAAQDATTSIYGNRG